MNEYQQHAADAHRSFRVSADQRNSSEVAGLGTAGPRNHLLPTTSMCGKRKWAHLLEDDGENEACGPHCVGVLIVFGKAG